MKVLFAVSSENISEVIIKKYQQEYKEIITGKNVYYFNAILKELQKDKTYDRIVISEDLEPFANNNFETMDKFIFDKLDNISDEATNSSGEDIPIILICTDRRTKSDSILVKLFGISIYNALMGTDRSIEQVCNLINRPRTKKEAKLYYKIDSEEVKYEAEDEESVSEEEIQSILRHYRNLGKNEDRYAESFNIIAAQYTDKQLILIIKCLPVDIRAVLETTCPKYQQLTTFMPKVQTKASSSNNSKNKSKEKQAKIKSKQAKEKQMISKATNSKAINSKTSKKSTSAKLDKNIQKNKSILNTKIDILEKNRDNVPRGNIIVPGVKSTIKPTAKPISRMGTKPVNAMTKENNEIYVPKNSKTLTDNTDIRNNKVEVEEMRNSNDNIKDNKQIQMNKDSRNNNNISRNGNIQDQIIHRPVRPNGINNNDMQKQKMLNRNIQSSSVQNQGVSRKNIQGNTIPRQNMQSTPVQRQSMINQNGMQRQKMSINEQNKENMEPNIQNQKLSNPMPVQEVKRGRGRPRKIQPEQPVVQEVKRGRGRPRKIQPEQPVVQEVKRGRGRPRKIQPEQPVVQEEKRGRGRPRKIQPEQQELEPRVKQYNKRPELQEYETQYNNYEDDYEEGVLPGMQDDYEDYEDYEEGALPGIEDEYDDYEEEETLPGIEDEYDDYEEEETLPGIEDEYDDYEEEETLPGIEDEYDDYEEEEALPGTEDEYDDYEEEETLPGMQDEYDDYEEDETLPGMQDEYDDYEEEETLPGMQDEYDDYEEEETLPGMQDEYDDYEEDEEVLPGMQDEYQDYIEKNETNINKQNQRNNVQPAIANNKKTNKSHYIYETREDNKKQYRNTNMISNLLTSDKKIAAFVGTTKNGTSFLVNNLAEMISGQGVRTAILDLTTNRNSYYIYTQNDEELRKIAYSSISKLSEGIAEGIQVNRNLSVYTCLPDDEMDMDDVENILSTLVQNYSLVLLDCDFNTNYGYFAETQELYLVQSMDVLTIQPLTAFLRDLKAKNILDEEKLRVVINKDIKVKSLTEKTIIGGMAYYNDPAMSFMTELFNKDTIRNSFITFDEQTYSKYLEGIVNCKISLNGYSKEFLLSLKNLASMVYPLVNNRSTYDNGRRSKNYKNDNLPNNMNNNRMRNNY